jgi:N-acetylmuramoyl-L-alanine amidase
MSTRVNKPTHVIIHCAATPDYKPANKDFDCFGAEDIDLWHRERGFVCIGYHWVIRRTGVIEKGRKENEIGAHTRGRNINTIGICYIGSYLPTPPQLESFCQLYREIKKRHKIGWENWLGHHEINAGKDCPGFQMDIFRKILSLCEYKEKV